MFIKEIELYNFRIYKGLNKISLLPSDDKNIIIISGKNGFGKTTFLMSLVWCLYGKQMEKVDEIYAKEIRSKGNYTKYIADSLNHLASENGDREFYVSITFSDVKIPDITCNEVTIKRSYNVVSSSTDKVEVLIDGNVNQLTEDLTKDNQKGEEIFIRDFILPLEIAKFFFFDAEKIVSLAEVSSHIEHQQLSKAYSEVLGIQKYEELKANLEEKQDDYRRRSAKPEEKAELNQLHTDIQNTCLAIEQHNTAIENFKNKQNLKEKEAEDIQRRLIREGDRMSVEELDALKLSLETLQIELDRITDELKEFLDLIPFALAGETLSNVYEQAAKERALSELKFRQEDINEKINQIRQDIEVERSNVNFILDVKTRDFYEMQIRKLIKKYFYSDILEASENLDILHEFSSTSFAELSQLVNSVKHCKDKFILLYTKYSSTKNQYDGIRRKIRDAEKIAEGDYISDLRKKKTVLDRDIRELDKHIEDSWLRIGELNNQIKTYKQRQELLRKKIDESSIYSEKEETTKRVINRLQNFINLFKEEKKKSLGNNMLESLKKLLHKKDFISRVDVDIASAGDDIEIILFDRKNKPIDKSALSMGERQMYASALLSSLVDESEIEFPVFIDSPMQKFDEQHAKNIIRYFYPSVSKQVVLFPLINKELTEGEYAILQPKVSKTFLINNKSAESSEFIETMPENFIKKYNELYHAN